MLSRYEARLRALEAVLGTAARPLPDEVREALYALDGRGPAVLDDHPGIAMARRIVAALDEMAHVMPAEMAHELPEAAALRPPPIAIAAVAPPDPELAAGGKRYRLHHSRQ